MEEIKKSKNVKEVFKDYNSASFALNAAKVVGINLYKRQNMLEINIESGELINIADVLDLEKYMSKDNISIDGVIKGFIGFGMTTLLINYSVRYVTAIFCILTMPLCIMFSISSNTRGIFNSWLRISVVTLCEQWLVKLLLIIPISFRKVDEEMFKIVIVGTVYLLYKINSFSKEFLGSVYTRKAKE